MAEGDSELLGLPAPPEATMLAENDISVKEHHWGAWTGEFPTIIVAAISAVVGGFLGSIGKDIWALLKTYLRKRYEQFEQDRNHKAAVFGTSRGRFRVLMAFAVTSYRGVPVVYFTKPEGGRLELEFNENALRNVEHDIQTLIERRKLDTSQFLGVDLRTVGRGPCLHLLDRLPDSESIWMAFKSEISTSEAWTHAIVAMWFEELSMVAKAREHYQIAIGALPGEAGLLKNMGITFAKEGDLGSAMVLFEEAAAIDGKYCDLHYNVACFHAQKGDASSAAKELHLAFENGFKDLDYLLKDDCFSLVLNDAEFSRVIEELGKKVTEKTGPDPNTEDRSGRSGI